MRIRPYRSRDFINIKQWIQSEEEHIFWCANLFEYPITSEALESKRAEMDEKTDGSLFTALDQQGNPIGFFAVMRADYTINNAHLGFIVIDPAIRGKGIGKELVNLALWYCFTMLSVDSVTLKVYDENESAHNCYQAVGFTDVLHSKKSLIFQGKNWGAWDMIITRKKMARA